MKYKYGEVCYNFQTDKNGGIECSFSTEDCRHLHVKCDWATFCQLWPSKQAEAKQAAKPPAKPKVKAAAKGKDGKAGAAAASAEASGGEYGSSNKWQPKNMFEEAEGDVEDE